MNYPLIYRWRQSIGLPSLPGRFGQACRVVARGSMNARWIEFDDGFVAIVSGNALGRRR